MRGLRPQTAFLLRGSALAAGMLALWWFALLDPLLYLMRESANACAGVVYGSRAAPLIRETAGGDWSFETPLEFSVPAHPPEAAAVRMRSVSFDLARADAAAFTFSLPVFWALALAAPGTLRRRVRPLVLGTAAMWLAETGLVLFFAAVFARQSAAGLSGTGGAISAWLLNVGHRLAVGVIPYVAPFAVAMWVDAELRGEVLGLARVQPAAEKERDTMRRGRAAGR